jgi:hypothetical protein
MNVYSLPIAKETHIALLEATNGVRKVATSPFGTKVPGVGTVYLELFDGRWLSVHADQHDLGARFEVFPIAASLVSSRPATKLEAEYALEAPVLVTELETEDWLDPSTPCGQTFGSNPIAQFQDLPGMASESASAKCNYVSGVRFAGSNGRSVVVATLAFPYAMYCSVFPEGASRAGSPHVLSSANAA